MENDEIFVFGIEEKPEHSYSYHIVKYQPNK